MTKSHFTLGSLSLLLLVAGAHGCAGQLDDVSKFLDAGPVGNGGSTGAGGSAAGGSAMAGTGGSGQSCNVQMLFTMSCALDGCHKGSAASAGIDFSNLPSVQAQVGQSPMAGVCAGTPGIVVIDSTTPTNSLIYQALGTPPCGLPMPYGGGALSSDQKACILSWLQSVPAGGGGNPDASTGGMGGSAGMGGTSGSGGRGGSSGMGGSAGRGGTSGADSGARGGAGGRPADAGRG
jgi:hypothetical protein